jgi:Spy/CpxP family protein refolding chaperone
MTKRLLIAAGLVAALAAGSAVSFAQGPGPGGRGGPGFRGGPHGRGPGADLGLRGVQLTDAQREQMRSIMQNHRTELESVGKALREAHRAFADAVRAGDEATIRSSSTAVGTAMADEAILRAKVRAEAQALLTPEQQQQLKERETERQQRMQEREQRLQQRRQQQPPPQ